MNFQAPDKVDFLKKHITSQASYVQYGYGQVEPNHLSAQRTAQVYAQLPAHRDIKVLEQGQFVKYDYAKNQVNFTGEGEWMLVMNEVKTYDARETYKDIAKKLNETKRSRDKYIVEFIEPVKKRLQEAGFNFEIKGRTKSIHSIWNKIKKRAL